MLYKSIQYMTEYKNRRLPDVCAKTQARASIPTLSRAKPKLTYIVSKNDKTNKRNFKQNVNGNFVEKWREVWKL